MVNYKIEKSSINSSYWGVLLNGSKVGYIYQRYYPNLGNIFEVHFNSTIIKRVEKEEDIYQAFYEYKQSKVDTIKIIKRNIEDLKIDLTSDLYTYTIAVIESELIRLSKKLDGEQRVYRLLIEMIGDGENE